ncbi:MAG: GyrI-like domain-containing protein [Sneathiella sp.]|nr:GyrI-like domain-containing protein [Sneathiella sp.]
MALFGWLINSQLEAADALVFQIYLNNPRDTQPADLLTNIHLPLKAVHDAS